MGHEIDQSNGRDNMAYAGSEVPWHGLGVRLHYKDSLSTWRREAGLEWNAVKSAVLYSQEPQSDIDPEEQVDYQVLDCYEGRSVLLRDDTKAPLSIVSDSYQIVQPSEVMEFYRSLIDHMGFRMHTAGSLQGGRKIWALADCNHQINVSPDDRLNGYLLLATSYDGSLCTTAQFTTVRVVCNNTLSIAVRQGEEDREPALKIAHNKKFDPDLVKWEMGLADRCFSAFTEHAKEMAAVRIDDKFAVEWLVRVMGNKNIPADEQTEARNIKNVFDLWNGAGRGAELHSAKRTLWGLVNSVTEFLDHSRKCRSIDNRLNSAWFGQGNNLKHKAWAEAVKVIQGRANSNSVQEVA